MDLLRVLISSIAFRTGVSPQRVKLYASLAAIAGALTAFLRAQRGPQRGRLLHRLPFDVTKDHAGILVGDCLKQHGVKFIFTLCGGHISPILIGARQHGIRIIDVRHEATAAFAADCVSRLTGIPGVCAVTAGPGLSNTVTAVKNAQLAQSPLIIFGGATSDLLKGRHSLQDIDQFALLRPHVKWSVHIARVAELVPMIEKAFCEAQSGTPGPVFIEVPLDCLYVSNAMDEVMKMIPHNDLASRAVKWWVKRTYDRMFANLSPAVPIHAPLKPVIPIHSSEQLTKALALLQRAKRPMLVLGSQVVLDPSRISPLVKAVRTLGLPTWLQGMCRGLLGANDPLYIRNNRSAAFSRADFILICGVPFDFRTGYGLSIPFKTTVVAVNRDKHDLHLNSDFKLFLSPSLAVHGDSLSFLVALADKMPKEVAVRAQWDEWRAGWTTKDQEKEVANQEVAELPTEYINPVKLCLEIDPHLAEDSILVGDGGDFVATVAYNVRARKPLSWLDPGVYGTLGIGAGFALAAKLVAPEKEVWLFWGDGACGYSLMELDTYKRHNVPVICVVGNDACWTQIYRGQMDIFGDDAGCTLDYTEYHSVAKALGCEGIQVDDVSQVEPAIKKAKELAAAGKSVLINAKIGKTEFRKGSMSF